MSPPRAAWRPPGTARYIIGTSRNCPRDLTTSRRRPRPRRIHPLLRLFIEHGSARNGLNSDGSTDMASSSYDGQTMPVARPDCKVKLTCVGDGGVGKVPTALCAQDARASIGRTHADFPSACAQTCLLIVYSQRRFPTVSPGSWPAVLLASPCLDTLAFQDYIPTVFEN